MAAYDTKVGSFRFLISEGADAGLIYFLPMRKAAASGDASLVRYLIDLTNPSDWALADARDWATERDHVEVLREIAMARSRKERVELDAGAMVVDRALPPRRL